MKGLYTTHRSTSLGVPQQTAARFLRYRTKSEPEKDSMAKLGGTAELFGPFYRERMALF